MTARAGPGWRAVHDEVVRRISAGVWPPGEIIPGEEALAAEFGCARATVGRALRKLAEDGLLERRRRAGTRVAAAPVRKAVMEIPLIRREIEAGGAAYRHVLLAREVAPPAGPLAARLGLAPDRAALRLLALHLADGRPWASEERWVNPDGAPGALEADFARENANEWLVRHAPYTHGDSDVLAVAAGPEEAARLDAPAGAPVLVAERFTWRGETPVTAVRLVHAPGRRIRLAL